MLSHKNKAKLGAVLIIALTLFSGYEGMTNKDDFTQEAVGISCYKKKGNPHKDLIIYVTNNSGFPIENVNVTISWNEDNKTKFTDITGYVQWKLLKCRWYNISIEKYLYQNITEEFNHNKKELRHYILLYFDVYGPEYYNLSTNATSTMPYDPNMRIMFNCTWIDKDSEIDSVIFYLDYESYIVKTNISSRYYLNISNISVGNHKYYWWCNDSIGNSNQTSLNSFAIIQEEVREYPDLTLVMGNYLIGQAEENNLIQLIGFAFFIGALSFGLTTLGLAIYSRDLEKKVEKLSEKERFFLEEYKKQKRKERYK